MIFTKWNVAEMLNLDNIEKLNGSSMFFGKIVSNIEKANFENLTNEQLKRFENFKNKQILGQNKNIILYRIAGKIYVNKKTNGNWGICRIY